MQKIGLKKTEEGSCCFYFAVSVFINLNQAQSVKQSNNHKGDCFLHHSHNPLFCFFSVLFFFSFLFKGDFDSLKQAKEVWEDRTER